MKVLMAPVNIAGQPIQIVEELRGQGVDARLLQYTSGGGHPFGYRSDKLVNITPDRRAAQFSTLKSCLAEGYDIFHFWLRSLFYGRLYRDFLGLDVPFIKARGRKVVYRFTGFDLRLKSEDMSKNPYSAFHYGFDLGFDEEMQRRYIAFLEEYVDEFIVQDPEMHDFFPRAKVVPRVIDLDSWPYVGVSKTESPLIVHAPSKKKIKGSAFVQGALDDLKSEGLNFSYKPIVDMKHEEAIGWYKRADIIVDQLHVGWYGVLALEGMALGKSVVVYMREELLDRFEHKVPIQNANPDTVKESLRSLIKDYDKRAELGRLSRAYVEEVHDIKKVVAQLIGLYEEVLNTEPTVPQSFADIEYFEAQLMTNSSAPFAEISPSPRFQTSKYSEFSEKLPTLRFKANKYDELLEILPALRFKAHKYDELVKTLPRLRYCTKRYEEFVNTLTQLRLMSFFRVCRKLLLWVRNLFSKSQR